MKCGIQYIPFVIVILVVGTTIVTFYLSYIQYNHVTYILPYISDTGTYPPESCIFGQALNIASVLISIAQYVKYLQVREMYQKHHIDEMYDLNKIAFIIGLVASLGVTLVANFQETNAFTLHWFAAILAFGGGCLYLCLQTLLYVKISPVIGQRKTTMFRMLLLSLVGSISFIVFLATAFIAYGKFKGDDMTKWKEEDGGYHVHQISTNAEWVCAACIMIYISMFYQEFKCITVKPISIVLDEHANPSTTVTATIEIN